jgi:hypothetical protein
MISPEIAYVYKIMFSADPQLKMAVGLGNVLRWNNGNGMYVFKCHKDKGFFLKYWNYKDKLWI